MNSSELPFRLVELESVGSTNTWLAQQASSLPGTTVVTAHTQTAGRGQRGNTWESEPGKNLTFSMLLHPAGIPAREQFRVSEAVALGVVDALRQLVPSEETVAIKWPNDIYVGNRKICGILIENVLEGSTIARSIAGIGINVNQREFLSDAPNPVSLIQLTGREYSLRELLVATSCAIIRRLSDDSAELHEEYTANLWARSGMNYRDTATGQTFHASIHTIGPMGHITLRIDDSSTPMLKTYAFKEVSVILP